MQRKPLSVIVGGYLTMPYANENLMRRAKQSILGWVYVTCNGVRMNDSVEHAYLAGGALLLLQRVQPLFLQVLHQPRRRGRQLGELEPLKVHLSDSRYDSAARHKGRTLLTIMHWIDLEDADFSIGVSGGAQL
eukprot:9503605-Pyramimonas_sp.AAC.1